MTPNRLRRIARLARDLLVFHGMGGLETRLLFSLKGMPEYFFGLVKVGKNISLTFSIHESNVRACQQMLHCGKLECF